MVRVLLLLDLLRSSLSLLRLSYNRDLLFNICGSVFLFNDFLAGETIQRVLWVVAIGGTCVVWLVGFRETSPRLSTIRHRHPCRPSPSVHSTAHEEQYASARISCRGRES